MTATVPRPTVTDPQLVVLAEVERDLVFEGAAAGASQVGFRRGTLDRLLEAGHLTRADTGDPDTDGGRYRLYLTDSGREQLERARAHRLLPVARGAA